MKIFVDIETIPDQSDGAIERYMGEPVKCPFTTKGDIGKDLGLDADTIKFTGANDLKALWVEQKGADAEKAQAEEKWLKTSFDGAYGEIIAISCAFNGGSIIRRSVENYTEAKLLEDFWQDIADTTMSKPKQFIAHNANFDFPFLWKRSVINGVWPKFKFDPHQRQGEKRYCTMEAWAGYKGMISLDSLAGILGVEGKGAGMTGADVWPEYQKGNIAKISEYCGDDVKVLRDIYNKLSFSGGLHE